MPAIQRWLERFSRDRDRQKRIRQGNEMAAVVYFRRNPELLTQYMVQVGLRALLTVLMIVALHASQ